MKCNYNRKETSLSKKDVELLKQGLVEAMSAVCPQTLALAATIQGPYNNLKEE